MGSVVCPEMSVTNYLSVLQRAKSKDLIYIMAED